MKVKLFLPVVALMLLVGLRTEAQQETFISGLYSFTNGNDGAFPLGSLLLSGNTLYGVTSDGGTNGNGTIFAINTNGALFTVLHTFEDNDGYGAQAGLILSGNTLYGTATYGGTNGNGTVFAVNADGTNFSVLHSFNALVGNNSTNSDGAYPYDSLVLSGNTLYGTTFSGGTNGNGTVFAINTDGTCFTNLYNFSTIAGNKGTNGDGAHPYDCLILLGNMLYGTAEYGGTNGNGTIFALNTNGTGFTDLHAFSARTGNNNSDGANPYCGLILSGNTLYGTAEAGGINGKGTVFAINTDGTGFTTLYNFSALVGNTNSDGTNPQAGLILSRNTLYGTAEAGGINGKGTVFAINTDGTGFTTLHAFTGGDGAHPEASLALSGDTLFGTAGSGGTGGYGTVFSLAPPPSMPLLNVVSLGNQVVILYPLTGTNYTLQTTTNLPSGTWVNVTNGVPLVAIGITNSSPAAFFRLH